MLLKQYKETLLDDITLTCRKDTPPDVMKGFLQNNLYIPDSFNYSEDDREVFATGVFELIHNAIRASIEKNTYHPIHCNFKYTSDELVITITDGAGGFDPEKILFKPGVNIEYMAADEIGYHANTGRGGFGLWVASRIFSGFELNFIDKAGNIVDYRYGKTHGTKVKVKVLKNEKKISSNT